MIRTEFYGTVNGKRLIRTYSDSGFRIVQNGTLAVYDEAIDPEDMNRTYTESTGLIDDDITAEQALDILMGGDGNAEMGSEETTEDD